MKAVVWNGPRKVSVDNVDDPRIEEPTDAVIRITATAICGSDLHLYDGYVPEMKRGDIVGHEFMGEVVEVGPGVGNLAVGDRVVVPFPITCGGCWQCGRQMFSRCENTNPNAGLAEKMWGHAPAGIFGYSHLTGGYAGGQAEYVRVPFADVGPLKVDDDSLTDEQLLFLTDVFPTGWMGAEACEIEPGDTVAVWGAGPVGQFAAASARLMGAERIVVIDRFGYRLQTALDGAGATDVLNYEDVDVRSELLEMTAGRGPDKCIDAVGLEAHHGSAPIYAYDRAKQATRSVTDRGFALRQAITCCRSGGVVSVPGVYGGFMDKFPIGSWMNRSITLKGGQTHVHRYLRTLYDLVQSGRLDPSFILTHTMSLEDAPKGYEIFKHKQDDCLKVVLKP
ncbi:MAG: zinc-dependent alcohol dehydrogenase [Mycobacteriales bacterium]